MRIIRIVLSLLLIIGSAKVFAEPAGRSARDAVRDYHFQFQSIALDKDVPQGQQKGQPPEQRQRREFGVPDTSGGGAPGENQPNASPDSNRKQGKLTPEERRALRRQIDEAGHDIYTPRR